MPKIAKKHLKSLKDIQDHLKRGLDYLYQDKIVGLARKAEDRETTCNRYVNRMPDDSDIIVENKHAGSGIAGLGHANYQLADLIKYLED